MADEPHEVQSDQVVESLESMTGSAALARVVKESLRTLAGGRAGPELAEVAREALAGRFDLRDVGKSAAYAETFSQQLSQFASWYQQLDDEQREQVVAEARKRISAVGQEEQS